MIVLLLSINTVLVGLSSLFILLRLRNHASSTYIVQYRSNRGLNAFENGGAIVFIEFVAFMVFVLVFHYVLSRRVYHIRRRFATTILALGTLLIVLSAVVSNALLSV
ncbi:hypothetical protein CR970_02005 [Candidatus Saccharibacteria bacterium]|nr:MAG: hypothetical protein CR970_02005 [Candidatus Saccharibacteria bacterium]